jgi:chemotaxis protein methyltransferase CheR
MTPESFQFLTGLVKARSGIVLNADKAYMLDTRLAPILKRERLASMDALAGMLRSAPSLPLAAEVVEALTTNESSFFRDGKPFDHLRQVLPKIAASRPAGQALRIWSAAASTGQEAYSVAIIVNELGPALAGRRVEILGTDLSREVLARAQDGLFSQFEVQRGLPVQLLVKYFKPDAGRWRISDGLRAMVRWQCFNLLENPAGLGRFDIIFCRNVLIYFDSVTKTQVLSNIANQLQPDGYVYLGGAETVLGLTTRLAPSSGERGAYELMRSAAKAS